MKMCCMQGFPLLLAHSSVLLLRLELMVFWILQEDHFVIPVKVFFFPLNLSLLSSSLFRCGIVPI